MAMGWNLQRKGTRERHLKRQIGTAYHSEDCEAGVPSVPDADVHCGHFSPLILC